MSIGDVSKEQRLWKVYPLTGKIQETTLLVVSHYQAKAGHAIQYLETCADGKVVLKRRMVKTTHLEFAFSEEQAQSRVMETRKERDRKKVCDAKRKAVRAKEKAVRAEERADQLRCELSNAVADYCAAMHGFSETWGEDPDIGQPVGAGGKDR